MILNKVINNDSDTHPYGTNKSVHIKFDESKIRRCRIYMKCVSYKL